MAVELDRVSYTYAGSSVPALEEVSMRFERGTCYGIIGATGSGKTTLCHVITGIAPHFLKGSLSGEVRFDGVPLGQLSVDRMAERVGYVFQNPLDQLSRVTFSVADEIAFGLQNLARPREEIVARVEAALGMLGIVELRDRQPVELSGGQLQRLCVAAAIAARPPFIVMDEPTSQLDPRGTREVFDAIAALKAAGLAVIVAEHQVDFLARTADIILVLREGRVVAVGPPRQVFADSEFSSFGAPRPSMVEVALAVLDRPTILPITPEELCVAIGKEFGDEH